MESVLTGALRRRDGFPRLRQRLEEAGFGPLVSEPVLVPMFVIVDLRGERREHKRAVYPLVCGREGDAG